MKRSNKKGFTIVELVIVIAIIAILAAVLIPTFASLIQKANESNDIQAAKNMNTFLAAANVTGDVKSILDVYDLFDESGYSVENYKPLCKDRFYYYDKEYNQILYVDEKLTVIYPTEHKGKTYETLKHNWMSLSMTVETKAPDGYKGIEGQTITATVKTGAEYAYVINDYNKASGKTNLVLTVDGTLDMKGAACFIEKSKGEITITGKADSNAVIKNMTSNKATTISNSNSQNKDAFYGAAAVVAKLEKGHTLTITGVTFENMNVKEIYTGSIGLLVGESSGTISLSNVTIKDSTVIGQRDVGAIVGQGQGNCIINLNGDVTLDNVNIKTIGGRSALLGRLSKGTQIAITNNAKFNVNNSKVSIYESKVSEQKFADGRPTEKPDGWDETAWKNKTALVDQERYIYSVKTLAANGDKTYSVYGFIPDAVIIRLIDKDSAGVKQGIAYQSVEDYNKAN